MLFLDLGLNYVRPYERKMWKFSSESFDILHENLNNSDFSFCDDITDVNEACKKWTDLFITNVEISIPSTVALIRPNDKPWYNNYLRRLLRIKNRAEKPKVKILNKIGRIFGINVMHISMKLRKQNCITIGQN
jgi:hypothetical protein